VSAIAVDKLTKAWDDTTAVDGISFEAPEGQFTVLLGPSGCGKSTTLRLIAGLESVTAGRVVIGGQDVTAAPPAKRDLSMVFQSYALFPHLTVAENILFGLRVRKVARAEREERLRRTAGLLGLSELLARRPSQLSGGQQQRVALGRAIIAEKPVCLMDEPLSNLDAKLRHEMRLEIRALQRKLGISMIYVTHDQAEAMSMADRVVLLREGRIEQTAPPEEIYQRPASSFVARFIGTPPMNILRLAEKAGGAVIEGLEQPAILDGPLHGTPGSGLCLGLRPEDLRIGDGEGVPATVRDLEYLGADTIVECDLGGQRAAVRAHGRIKIEPGARVCLVWHPESMHFFESSTGRRRDDLRPAAPVAALPAQQA
jgi:sn-glycerol 3-phosphate transport system ATP-binding protein